MKHSCKISLLAAALALVHCPARAQDMVNVYVSPPGITSAEDSSLPGVTASSILTENFNTRSVGAITSAGFTSLDSNNVVWATYASPNSASINAYNQYGGYNQISNANEGNYLSIGSGGSLTLQLANPVSYLGFDWYAGDANNKITLYNGNSLIGTYSTANLITQLPNTAGHMITATDGTTQYDTSKFYGEHGVNASGASITNDSSEPFAYIDMVAQGNTKITKIVFSQGTGGGNFETDNDSILSVAPDLSRSTFVRVGTVVPEPATGGCLAVGAAVFFAWQARRRRG